ncbi:MAG: hypothetical protein AUJ96_01950 [Armatimonadetes bacterium CG2_30_66_41]|nr:hypothetical protein [Armatimonadota bacterium]OIP11694.1 MAG: hypothetical protein AUJ96_01950 [Armatimonadetes bacterium CG2_30_66_41]
MIAHRVAAATDCLSAFVVRAVQRFRPFLFRFLPQFYIDPQPGTEHNGAPAGPVVGGSQDFAAPDTRNGYHAAERSSGEGSKSGGREADSVWAVTPAAATYEPLPGMKRTDFQAKVQTVEALFQPAAEAKKAAAMAAAEAQAVAKELHEAWVAWLKEARAVYRQGTPQRALLDGIETEKGGPSTPKPQLPPGV